MTTTNRPAASRGHLRAIPGGTSAEVPRNIHGTSNDPPSNLHGQEVEVERENNNPPPQGSATEVPTSAEHPAAKDQGGEGEWNSGDPAPKWCEGLIKRIRTEYPRKQWDADGGIAIRELVEALAPHGRAAALDAVNTIIRSNHNHDRFPPPIAEFHLLAKQSADAARRRTTDTTHDHTTHTTAPKCTAWLAAGILYTTSGIHLAAARDVAPFAAIARAHGLDSTTIANLVDHGQGFPQAALDDADRAWRHAGEPEPPAATTIAHGVAS